jgi:uncharacterized protein
VDEKYFNKISFNAVIDLSQDFSCANDFFMTYDEIKDLHVTGNYVNNINRTETQYINPQYYIDSQYEIFKIYLYYCKNIFNKYRPSLLNSMILSLRRDMYDRFIAKGQNQKCSSPGGQCLPGIQRLMVSVDGNLFPCERINESSQILSIGDIENGFDLERAKNILNIAKITEEECKNCWAFKLCSQCVSMSEQNGELSKEKRLAMCDSMRATQEHKIKNYIALKKSGCNFQKLY